MLVKKAEKNIPESTYFADFFSCEITKANKSGNRNQLFIMPRLANVPEPAIKDIVKPKKRMKRGRIIEKEKMPLFFSCPFLQKSQDKKVKAISISSTLKGIPIKEKRNK